MPRKKFTNVSIGKVKARAEIADTWWKKAKGLMFRKSLGEREAMLFVFRKKGFHSLWMFGMRFPIDIIWVDSGMKIVDVKENAKPWDFRIFTPETKSKYVLEANAGFCKSNKIKKGMKIKFNA